MSRSPFTRLYRRAVAGAVLTALLSPLGGCLVDPVRWRVRDPAAVALVRSPTTREPAMEQEVLPADPAQRSVSLSYTRRERRGWLSAEPCSEGPSERPLKLVRSAGPPYECRATAVAQRMPDGGLSLNMDGRSLPLLRADGTFPVPLWGQQYDPGSEQARVHLGSAVYGFLPTPAQPWQPSFRNDLNLMVVTPRANLLEAVRIQRPVRLLGWVLLGMAGAWLAGGGAATAMGQLGQKDGGTFVAIGSSCLGVGLVFLGLGAAVLARPQQDVPLLPP
jgi:hypothetical protein